MRKNIFAYLLVMTILSCNLLEARKVWWEQDYDFYDYDNAIDYSALRRIIEQEMDRLFEPHKQTTVNRNYLTQVKEYAKGEICSSIGNLCSTHHQAKKLVITLTRELAIEIVVEWAGYIAQELLKNPPVNPFYISKNEIINAIKQVIRNQAHVVMHDSSARLTSLVQNLEGNVRVLVQQEIDYSVW